MNKELKAWKFSQLLFNKIQKQKRLINKQPKVKHITYLDSLFRRYHLCKSIINELPYQKINNN